MFPTDLFFILQWWFIWLILGLVFLPLTTIIFSSFFDKGYIFSKILGVLILSYTIWFLGSLKILPFSLWSLLLIFSLFSLLNLKLLSTRGGSSFGRKFLKIYLLEEALFLTGLIFWAYIRGFEPSIHGLEKYMDFGIINSILRSEYFPPKDIWMTPFSINYYYFGHLTAAVLTKISGINPTISYNLMLAALFGLTLSASFSIGANLYHFFLSHLQQRATQVSPLHIISGLLSALLVTLGGNLHTIYIFFQTYIGDKPVPFWQLPFMFNPLGYWYPNATRFIPFTIHEFPIYSFVVADLHGHVLNIPFVLLIIALLIKMFFTPIQRAMRASPLQYTDYILLGLLIAISLMANVLDGPIYLLVIFFVLLARQSKFENCKLRIENFTKAILYTILIAVGALLFSLPFWLSFKPFASGIGVLCAPGFLTDIGKIGPFLFEADHCARSPLWMMAILWGFFYFVIFGFILFILKLKIDLKFKIKNLKLDNLISPDLLVLTFALASTLLILIPEFFYAKDIYPAHYRANTVFKFGYQAFIILALISGYMITRFFASCKLTIRYTLYAIPLLILFLLVVIYPYFAINSYYGGLKNYQSLNGISYLSDLYPSDYQAILWLRGNVQRQPVVLEAQGDSYTDYARVSSNTGLPTVIGWPVHEWLWRGSYDEAGKRGTDVQTLYETPDLNLTKKLIDQYNIEYVFIGALERQKYLKLNEEKFINLGKLIFQDGITRVYQLK